MSPDTAILQLTQAKGLGAITLDRVLKRLSREGRVPQDLVMASVDELVRDYGLRQEVAQAVKTTREAAAKLADELAQQQVQVLVKGAVGYPDHLLQVLGDTAPPVLFAKGNLEILQRQAVGFTGSRRTSEKGLRLAEACADGLARGGINIVSGYASGTDLAAHRGALRAGGATTLVLVEGILNFRIKRELAEWFDEGNCLVLSEFSPQTRWIARHAMQRNRTICGLSDAMILTESGLTGGTFAAGETTLELQLPLVVVEYAHPPNSAAGNAYFLKQGAIGLRGDRYGQPKLDAVFRLLGKESDPNLLAPALSAIPEAKPMEPAAGVQPEEWSSVQTQRVTESLTEKVTLPMPANAYPKRLIEVDLPIKRIPAHARREKSIRHGHISTLHIWWARRPLAACRAVICAALWPDPVDELCPQAFREAAARLMAAFAQKAVTDKALANHCSQGNWAKWQMLARLENPFDLTKPNHLNELRYALLDFIADFANWDNSTQPDYLATSRALTQAAHEALGWEPGTRPLVVDPFAGGGSIPLEALRVGADAFASDLNPVAVLLNKVVLEYIPKYGQKLADEVRKWGQWVKEEAEKELAEFYPKDPDGSTPIAYLWARTIICEGPGCGAEVPLMRSLWLAKKSNRSIALRLHPNLEQKRVDFEILEKHQGKWICTENSEGKLELSKLKEDTLKKLEIKNPNLDGTVKRGSATCPCCSFTTSVASVRKQLKARKGGANDARLFCVVLTTPGEKGRFYRLAKDADLLVVEQARKQLNLNQINYQGELSFLPEEPTSQGGGSGAGMAFYQRNYGMDQFQDLFTDRQLLALTTLTRLVQEIGKRLNQGDDTAVPDSVRYSVALLYPLLYKGYSFVIAPQFNQNRYKGLEIAVQAVLSLGVSKITDVMCALVTWQTSMDRIGHLFTRQAISMAWDFSETFPISEAAGDYSVTTKNVLEVLDRESITQYSCGSIEKSSACNHPLPDEFSQYFFTDPPYYDAVPYADLSDFFYVWLKRTLPSELTGTFTEDLTPKQDECVVDEVKGKDRAYFERTMAQAMAEGRRVLAPDGIGVVVFAHKSTAGWEAQLQAMVDAGWVMTGSWPIDTEMGTRLRARDSAALASSVHLVCRPRENPDGSLQESIGDWRDVLQELPHRIHDWMPRLATEGVVGADAIFACLGPALEIFSRYSRVEKASGEPVTLREYLEHVWAAVSKEALSMIFDDADTSDFEADARLTAMWLWTLSAGESEKVRDAESGVQSTEDEGEGTEEMGGDGGEDETEASASKTAKTTGYTLEFDAARKIAQGLGAHLDKLTSLVHIKGDKATLLAVSDRAPALFGKNDGIQRTGHGIQHSKKSAKSKVKQLDLFAILDTEGDSDTPNWNDPSVEQIGQSVLDRLHQSMILFAAGRSDALKRFLVDDGVGTDPRFWKLAQALSALYPTGTDEKRWVDGVLARKKGLGF